MSECVFCDIIAGTEIGELVYRYNDSIVLKPLNPVTPGHMLVIPMRHVRDASAAPDLAGRIAGEAARFASAFHRDCDYNLITSCGPSATQTVFHLHWHIVPRYTGDGLHLPWTGQEVVRHG